VIFSISARR